MDGATFVLPQSPMPSNKEKRKLQQRARRAEAKAKKEQSRLRHNLSQSKYRKKQERMNENNSLDQPSPVRSEVGEYEGSDEYNDSDESFDSATKDRVANLYTNSMKQQRLAGADIMGGVSKAAVGVAKETQSNIRITEAVAVEDIKSMSSKKKKKKKGKMLHYQSAGQTAKTIQFSSEDTAEKNSNMVRNSSSSIRTVDGELPGYGPYSGGIDTAGNDKQGGSPPATNDNGNENGFTFKAPPATNDKGNTTQGGFTFKAPPANDNGNENGFTFKAPPANDNGNENGFTFKAPPATNQGGFTFKASPAKDNGNENQGGFFKAPPANDNGFGTSVGNAFAGINLVASTKPVPFGTNNNNTIFQANVGTSTPPAAAAAVPPSVPPASTPHTGTGRPPLYFASSGKRRRFGK